MTMHDDEVPIDEALVRRLLEAQFPQLAHLPVEPVQPWGTDNALFRLGGDRVVRLPRHGPSVAPMEKERRWLPWLAPYLPLAVPVPVAGGIPGEGYPFPWSIYTWLEGEDYTSGRVSDPNELARDLAGFILALQRIDPSGGPAPGEHNFYRGVPLVERDTDTRESIEALAGRIDVDAVTALWEDALHAPAWEGPPVWIHGDLDARNLLCLDGRLSGVIDFGGLGVGDPACDVMVAWKVFSAGPRETFREALSVDDATWARARGWVLSQALMALPYYTMETNPTLVLEAQRWLAEVLSDRASST